MISKRNKGNSFPKETKGLFYKETIRSFPQEMIGRVSSGKLCLHYIMFNFQTSLDGQEKLNNGFK